MQDRGDARAQAHGRLESFASPVPCAAVMVGAHFLPVIPLALGDGGFVHQCGIVLEALLLEIFVLASHARLAGCCGFGLTLVAFQCALLLMCCRDKGLDEVYRERCVNVRSDCESMAWWNVRAIERAIRRKKTYLLHIPERGQRHGGRRDRVLEYPRLDYFFLHQ
jgi:hypothetical protein